MKFNSNWNILESPLVAQLEKDLSSLPAQLKSGVSAQAKQTIEQLRVSGPQELFSTVTAHLPVTTPQGAQLLRLCESFLRVKDPIAQKDLIEQFMLSGAWETLSATLSKDGSWWMKGALSVANMGAKATLSKSQGLSSVSLSAASKILSYLMTSLSHNFIFAQDLASAMKNMTDGETAHSIDTLGEAAKTHSEVQSYFEAYENAILTCAKANKKNNNKDFFSSDSISIKLSALSTSYSIYNESSLLDLNDKSSLVSRIIYLIDLAASNGVSITLDAEEASRLDLQLSIFECALKFAADKKASFGLAVQAYNKNAPQVIDYIISLAQQHNTQIPIRLVKGAYWDSEIKKQNELSWNEPVVFTKKSHTDICYLHCASKMLNNPCIISQFATHNPHTIAAVRAFAQAYANKNYEIQRLYGMAQDVHNKLQTNARIYCPVGSFETLLPYLVRRLIENSSSSSFLSNLFSPDTPIDSLVAWPQAVNINDTSSQSIPNCPSPNIFSRDYIANSFKYLNSPLNSSVSLSSKANAKMQSIYDKNITLDYFNPSVQTSSAALEMTLSATPSWADNQKRYDYLRHAACVMQEKQEDFIFLLVHEGGKTLNDAISEVRECIDFLNFYSNWSQHEVYKGEKLISINGEQNTLTKHPRGVSLCISPWNFPLAIFAGQVCANLSVGNTVIAKPSSYTPAIASHFVNLLHSCGIPHNALALLCVASGQIRPLLQSEDVSSVCFTGSTEVAKDIRMNLAQKLSHTEFLAETGGINCLIADASCLIDSLIADTMRGAFNSCGQRCSATRILFVHDSIYDACVACLKSAINTLNVLPTHLFPEADLGYAISAQNASQTQSYIQSKIEQGKEVITYKSSNSAHKQWHMQSNFIAPTIIEMDSFDPQSMTEVFAPVLHVYKYTHLPELVKSINSMRYGLTFGIHSRIDKNIEFVKNNIKCANIYINRSTISAVVGQQPFGGVARSGTGVHSGHHEYLNRLVIQKVVCENTAALGAVLELMQ